MAIATPIIMPARHKELTRRGVLAGLSGAAVALPRAGLSAAFVPDGAALIGADTGAPHPVLMLPFVRDACAAPRSFWAVQPTGNFIADCAVGSGYAGAALDYIVAANAPEILSWAVFDMMRLGRARSGVEIGFLTSFGRAALHGHAAGLPARNQAARL